LDVEAGYFGIDDDALWVTGGAAFGGADPDTGLFHAGLAYWLNRQLGVEAGPSELIGASNFFELAVATAIALFGFQSGAALSTVVGVLVEVPVMLPIVHLVRHSRGWYERAAPTARA
jgi:arsenite transporter